MLSKNRLTAIAMVIFAVYVLSLGLMNDLDLYIHPRYIVFTVIMSAVALLLAIGAILQHKSHSHEHGQSKLQLVPLALVVVAALFMPAKSLTSSTFGQRSTNNQVVSAATGNNSATSLFAKSSRGLGLSDWSRLLLTNTDSQYYTNKKAKISGFVYDADLGDNAVWLARFVVTCCAVDAQPIGVPVKIDGWKSKYKQDQWLEVEGEFKQEQVDSTNKIILVPEKITEIEEPSNPYAN